MKTKRQHVEHDMQAAEFKIMEPITKCKWIFAIPNAMPGNVRQQAWMQREGRRAGVSDIFSPIPVKSIFDSFWWHGLFIENKIKPNKLKKEQARFIIAMDAARYGVAVCFSTQEFVDIIQRYLRGEHSNTRAVELAKEKLKHERSNKNRRCATRSERFRNRNGNSTSKK